MPTAAEMRARHTARIAKRKRYDSGGAVDPSSWGAVPVADTPAAWGAVPVEAPAAGIASAVTDIPHQIYEAGKSALSTMGEAFNPYSATNTARMEQEKNAGPFDISGEIGNLGSVGKGILAVPQLAAAPITGAGRSLIGHTYDALSPNFTPEERQRLAQSGVTLPSGSDVADLAMSAAATARGGLPATFGPKPIAPVAPVGNGPLGVTLSEGQATGELPLIQREQAAIRGTSGAPAQERAQQFVDQQKAEVQAAKEGVAKSLDPFNMQVAGSPQEAGQLVSQGVRNTANAAKQNINDLYGAARRGIGEFNPGTFEHVGDQISSALASAKEPVTLDDVLTPFANGALGDVSQFLQKREASGPLSLTDLENARKRLVDFRSSAWKNSNSDGRAASAVVDAFDNQIDNAIKTGAFSGDPRAAQAWATARAAHADYRSTYSGGQGDPVGRVVEKITGKGQNPAAIPNDVADFLYGSTGTNPSTLNVNVANRVRSILGDQSPEWSAVKQGLFSRLVEPGEGMTDFGPGKVAQRINRFLNVDGKELSQAMYSPQERQTIQQYANLMRKLEVPQSGANWSNTATFAANALKKVGSNLGIIIGSAIGHAVGLPLGVAEGVAYGVTRGANKLAEGAQARAVARQMPLIANSAGQYQKALAAYQKSQSPLSTKAMTFAAGNLARTLAPLGIKLENLGAGMGTVNAPADQNQQQ